MTDSEDRLPLRETLAYGCGDFASVLYWQTFMKYLPYFYTDVFGLTAAALGSMLLVSRIVNGLSDPVVGIWADRTTTRWGKFRPFILFGCVPFVLTGVLTFTTPALGATGKLIWAYATFNALMFLYTLVNIPYTAMLGVLSDSPAARTRLSSVKFVFAFSAGMVISAVLLPLARLFGAGGQEPERGWQLSFVLVGVVALGFFLVTFFGTRERVLPSKSEQASVLGDLRHLVANRAWVLLLLTTFTFILFVAVRSSVFAHYFKYYVFEGDTEKEMLLLGVPLAFDGMVSTFNTGGQAASVLGVLFIAGFAAKFPKKQAFVVCFLIAIFSTAIYFVLPREQIFWLFFFDLIGPAASAPLPVLLWAMYADTADYGEWKTGRRTTGLVFSASSMGQKIAWAVGGFFAFQLLSSVGFRANVFPTTAVQESLVLLMSLAPSAIGLLSIVVFLFYPLNDGRVAEITAELKARRTAA